MNNEVRMRSKLKYILNIVCVEDQAASKKKIMINSKEEIFPKQNLSLSVATIYVVRLLCKKKKIV